MLFAAILWGSCAWKNCWREWTDTSIRSETVLNEIRDAYKPQRTLTQRLKGLHSRMFVITLFVLVTIRDNLNVHHQRIGRVECGRCRTLWNTQKQMTRRTHTYLKNIVFYSYCGITLNSKIIILKITISCKNLGWVSQILSLVKDARHK